MQNEQWSQLKENIRKKFQVQEERTEDLMMDTQDGPMKQGEVEFLIVETPLGRIKLAREIRPLLLEKKLRYSHRAGDVAQAEYKFSDTEKTYKLKLYKWDANDYEWMELTAENLASLIK